MKLDDRCSLAFRKQDGKIVTKFILILAAAVLIALLSSPQWLASLFPLPHEQIVMQSARKYDVDPYLVFAIIKAESGGQATACSAAGARGLMQLMPDTADWCAEQMELDDFDTEQLNNPSVNINMGCWYLKELYREFDGNETAVIAAYNAGLSNVQYWLATGTWDGTAERLDQIPFPETRDYVGTVQENYSYYKELYEPQKN